MLPAALRMRRSADFEATVRRGARAGRTTLVVHCRTVPERPGTHVGMVVARTVGNAVVRNKVRRRLRGVVIGSRAVLPEATDVVVRALPPAADATYDDLAKDFADALPAALARVSRRGAQSARPRS